MEVVAVEAVAAEAATIAIKMDILPVNAPRLANNFLGNVCYIHLLLAYEIQNFYNIE